MGVNELVVNNSINNNFYKIEKIINKAWGDTKAVVSGNGEDKYVVAKEMILDMGAEVESLLGNIVKTIDEKTQNIEEKGDN